MLTWLWKRLSDGGPQVSLSGRALRRFPDREIDRLLKARVLAERRKADTWSVCSHCSCGLDSRPIREINGQLRACCPYDVDEDEVLDPDDLRRFGIEADRLAETIAASGGLSGSVTCIDDGIWLLGVAPAGRGIVLCRDPERLMAPGAILAMRATAGTAPVTVLAAEVDAPVALRLQEAGVDTRLLAEVMLHGEGDRERLSLERLAPAAGAVRLVLDRRTQSAIHDGRRLDLPPQMFALFRILVEQGRMRDPLVRKQEIEARTGRPANEIIRDLRRSLVACGLGSDVAEALIVTVRPRGYRLGLPASEIGIEG